MTYTELVKQYQRYRQHYSLKLVTNDRAKTDVDCFMKALYDSLARDEKTHLNGVGVLKVYRKTAHERERYIPTSGDMVTVPEHEIVKTNFRPCPSLTQSVLTTPLR